MNPMEEEVALDLLRRQKPHIKTPPHPFLTSVTMKFSFVFAILSATTAVVALPATGTTNQVANVVERAPAAATTTAPAKKGKKKPLVAKPEVVPAAVKPVPTPASKSPKWSKNTHPKENVPKDFNKKKTGK
ncbi:hypothetical protein F5X68DRAFT_264491 [Plectosphaerella plurivora]|uniref:Uncharacterized protein n=1 Tax=Plectosphaerella plurivora TaxID=936078 RepID=A0A9P8V2R8_9PEZI|nr:hypothetical protein F5X68DRAFT_264491 [Plectosphaerella plurivora]